MFKQFAVAAALSLVAASSFAAGPTSFYAGGDVGVSKLDEVDGHHSSYGVFAGYGFNPFIAVEAGYRQLGKGKVIGYDLKVTQFDVSAVGTIPLTPMLDVYGRLGLDQLHTEWSDGDNDKMRRVLYGAGLNFDFDRDVAARVEVQRPASRSTNLSASIVIKF